MNFYILSPVLINTYGLFSFYQDQRYDTVIAVNAYCIFSRCNQLIFGDHTPSWFKIKGLYSGSHFYSFGFVS